ncbi:MAG: Sir2 silent information regulator family NAD-dependent deacetylase [Coriobacteriales bacterium]|nr:Sir2 silent information regulator family NAD-dependent deacetylase [Coriobacteriales bacterium]
MDTSKHTQSLTQLKQALADADAVVVGAGAGLSTSAGLTYAGERFEREFADFIREYGLTDMYSAGFYPFPTPEEQWAYWSRFIWCNRYKPAPKDTYDRLLRLLEGKDFFVITTNVDHKFQQTGFPKERLFYTQGDYGLWQCSKPCHNKTYDNRETVRRMVAEQRNMRIPSELVPTCPVCGRPMSMNLRADDTFVEDEGWHVAAQRYNDFLLAHQKGKVLYLELGVGGNTPVIIKYPFWQYVYANPQATYVCVNYGEAYTHPQIRERSILINDDIHETLGALLGDDTSAD